MTSPEAEAGSASPLSDRAVERLQAQLNVPAVIADRYELGAALGRGGMGEVFRAADRVLGRSVAVKVLAFHAPSPTYGELLRRESALLARLEHPGIVPVYDAGALDDGRVYYVMRLVDGHRLDAFARGDAPLAERLRVILRIAEAVAFAHQQGVLHCDLKPSNVMIGPFGDVLVLDWGIAHIVRSGTDATGGTPGYMAPEQGRGDIALSERADVFALGGLLREVVVGDGQVMPRPLAAIVTRATSADPTARYANAAEFGADVRRFVDGEAVQAHRESLADLLRRFVRKHQTAILLVTAYVLVRLFILAWRGI